MTPIKLLAFWEKSSLAPTFTAFPHASKFCLKLREGGQEDSSHVDRPGWGAEAVINCNKRMFQAVRYFTCYRLYRGNKMGQSGKEGVRNNYVLSTCNTLTS